MRGRSVWGGRGECWSIWASVFLAPWMEYDLISGQAVPRRPQWGNGVGVEAQNWSFMWWYQPLKRNGTNMADRKAFFPCRTIMLCSSIWATLPWWRSNIFPLISSCCITKSSQSHPLHYTTMQVLYLWMKERGGVSFPSTHNPEHWMSSLMKRAGSEICRTWKTGCTVQGGLSD